ncbi:MAG: carboxypeptidase regulatory-like domain-containing protein [Euryarchaeota archaeon]|nr:carboxypeptidase regulatory-like domain-containing protein [Euryarchaeota archaeon]
MTSRPLSFALVSMLVLGAGSGCLGAKSTAVPTAYGLVELEPGLVVAGDRGAVRGVVVNDAELPVPNAAVTIIGTDSFGSADDRGAFQFVNVTAGELLLRVEASGYTPGATPLLVSAGNLTSVTVRLLPDGARGAGYRPHVHDYWNGNTQYTLMDVDATVYQENSDIPRFHPAVSDVTRQYGMNYESSSAVYRIPVPSADEPPNLVFPGAAEVQVTLTWDPQDCTLDRLGLKYRTSATNSLVTLAPQASGTTFKIPVKPLEWDSGHQRVTFWDFYVHPANHATATTWKPGLLLGPIHVKIVAVKGDELPIEPPHEDFWGDATSLVVRKREDAPFTTATTMQRRDMSLEGGIVPPGANRMRMELWWSYAQGNGTAPSSNYVLAWRPGDASRETPITSYVTAADKFRGGQYLVYEIPLKPEQTDAFYQKRSNWRWAPAFEGHADKEFFPDGARSRTFQLQITVFRDAPGPVEE